MKQKQLNVLTSPCFLVSLSLLLLNDFIFKAEFHNAITGKISDGAGLAAFVLFWYAFFPHRKLFIYIATAAGFIFWKSPFSQPLIDTWNDLSFFSIVRTVDYTDSFALLVLPLIYFCKFKPAPIFNRRWATGLVTAVSVFAFTATSQVTEETPYYTSYYFSKSKKELLQQMSHLPQKEVTEWFTSADNFEVIFESCPGRATINVYDKPGSSVIMLKKIDGSCVKAENRDQMQKIFEDEVINKLLSGNGTTKSAKILAISAEMPAYFTPTPLPKSNGDGPRLPVNKSN